MIFKASMESLYPILEVIRTEAEEMGFEPSEIARLEIACEEAIVNIIHHAYPKNSKGDIDVYCFSCDNILSISFKDQGVAFNPLENAPEADLNSSAEDRKVGGLGLHFMHQIMDEVIYKREEGTNILELKKKISSKAFMDHPS